MSILKIYSENWGLNESAGCTLDFFDEETDISRELQAIGILYEDWETKADPALLITEADILNAYADQVRRLKNRHGFTTIDVVNLDESHPDKATLRQKFLSEHTHSDFEVRFFVAGQGLFYLHHCKRVYAVLCEQGTLISVPAGVKHWFDMGERPLFTCIRFFCDPDGWIAEYTGDEIAKHFPLLDQFLVEAA